MCNLLDRFDQDCQLYRTLFLTTDSYKNNKDGSYVVSDLSKFHFDVHDFCEIRAYQIHLGARACP